ncbi:MAG: hypothetical protein SGARI_002456, partial [Bacillariaceae sp.]
MLSLLILSIVSLSALVAGTEPVASCEIQDELRFYNDGSESFLVGDAAGTIGIYESGVIPIDEPLLVFSASKLVAGVLLMRLVERGVVDIHDKVSDYLKWWTIDPEDPRSYVELYHLITQTAIFGENPCSMDTVNTTTLECSREIYSNDYGVFRDVLGNVYNTPTLAQEKQSALDPVAIAPGDYFFYSESHFVLLGQVLSQITNMTWGELFFQEIATPSGMDLDESDAPFYVFASPTHVDPGAGLFLSGLNYGKFLQAYMAGNLVNETTMAFMESPHTLSATGVDTFFTAFPKDHSWAKVAKYGIGCWIVCDTEDCSGRRVVHSTGAGGFLPWMDRSNSDHPYWGIIVQYKANFESREMSDWGEEQSMALFGELLPWLDALTEEEWVDNCGDDDLNVNDAAGDGLYQGRNM